MAARASAPPPKPLTVPVAVVSVIAALALTWLRAPGALALYVGLLLAAILMVPPMLTGKPGADGVAKPQGGGEEAQLTQYRRWNAVRRYLAPSAAWMPFPVTTGTLAALGAALVAAVLPVDLQHELVPPEWAAAITVEWLPVLNAVSAFVVVHALSVAGRNADPSSEAQPAVGVGEILRQVKSRGNGLLIVLSFLMVIATGAGVMVWLFAAQLPEKVAEWVQYPGAMGGGVGLLLLAGLVHSLFAPAALLPWRQRIEARHIWEPRWAALARLPEVPSLTGHERFGDSGSWHADTFSLPASLGGARKGIALFEQMEHAFGAGTRAVFTSAPVLGEDGSPQIGTRDPNTMLAYSWPVAEPISLSAPGADPQQVLMLVQSCVHQAMRGTKIKAAGPIIESVTPLHSEDSSTALWSAKLTLPEDTGGTLLDMLLELRGAGLDSLIIDGDPAVALMQDDTELVFGVFADSTELADPQTGERLAFIAVQDYWRGRWDVTERLRTHPRLTDHRVYGPEGLWHVDVFEVPSSVGDTGAFLNGLRATVPADPSGRRTVFQSTPRLDTGGEEIPGTRDPARFAAYTWPEGSRPDIADPEVDLDLMRVWLQAMLKYATDEAGANAGPPVALSFTALHDTRDAATTAAWSAELVQPDVGVTMDTTVDWLFHMGGIDSMVTGEDPSLALLNDQDRLIFGRLDEATTFADPTLRKYLQQIYEGQEWQRVWSQAGAVQAPFPDWGSKKTANLPGGHQMHRISFSVPYGRPASDYLRIATDKIKTAMNPLTRQLAAVPALTRSSSAQEDLNDSKLSLVWSHDPISTSPRELRPDREPEAQRERASFGAVARESARTAVPVSRARGPRNIAQKMALDIAVAQAFSAAKLERPVVLHAQPLTRSTSREHLWDLELRLFGKLTLQDLRSSKTFVSLKNALSAPYLRVAPTLNGNIRMVMGAKPSELTEFVSTKEESMLIQLDWEQAFQAANVLRDGSAPMLADASLLPKNPRVQRLVFDLPHGMHPESFKGAKEKLSGARGMEFMDISPGPAPGQMTVLCSEEDPLRSPTMFDWEAVHTSAAIPFGSSVSGEPVEYDQSEDPHILVLGSSGSGKAQPMDAMIPVPLSEKFPTGWARNDALDVGDCVFTPDGSRTRVHSFSETRSEPVFTVTTDDGQSTRVSGHHMWRVQTPSSRGRSAFMRRSSDQQRAQALHALAGRVGTGVGATPVQIGALSGVGAVELERRGALQPVLVRRGLLSDGQQRATVFDTDAVLRHAYSVADSDGAFLFAGAVLDREDLVDLALEGTWLSAESLAEALLGRSASEAEADLATVLVQGLGAASRAGSHRRLVDLYPIDEVLHLLARGYEKSSLDDVIVTTESLADMIAAGRKVTIMAPAPVPGAGHFDASVFAQPVHPLPPSVRRGSARSRSRLVQLWLSQADLSEGEHRVLFPDRAVAESAEEVVRSTGLWARLRGNAVLVRSTPLQVIGVVKGASEMQRCLRTEDESHMYLTSGFVPTHNSAAMQAVLTGAIVSGFEAVIVDPMKGGVDFDYASDWIYGSADDMASGGALMARVGEEIAIRKALVKSHGVTKTNDLPEDVRPRPLVVVIDEFQSLMAVGRQPRMPDDATDQSAMEAFQQASTEYEAKSTIAEITGRVVREARSVQIMMILGAQNLPVKLLDSMPNNSGSGLKSNMSRLLVGKTSSGERMSALKDPDSAPQLGNVVPRGRGIFEGSGGTQILQVWYDSDSGDSQQHLASMRAQMASVREPIDGDARWDVGQLVREASGSSEQFGAVIDQSAWPDIAPVPPTDLGEVDEIDIGDFEFSFDDEIVPETTDDAEEPVLGDDESQEEAEADHELVEPVAAVDDVDWGSLLDEEELIDDPDTEDVPEEPASTAQTPERGRALPTDDLFGGPTPTKIDDDIFGSF